MKIGIVVDNELNNDIRVLREIGILKEQGYEIFVLCYGFRKTYKNPVSQINITRINIPRKLKDILFFFLNTVPLYEWIWASYIRKFISVTILKSCMSMIFIWRRGHITELKKAGKKIPLILDLHENYPYTVTTYNWTKGFLRGYISRPQEWQRKEREYWDMQTGLLFSAVITKIS